MTDKRRRTARGAGAVVLAVLVSAGLSACGSSGGGSGGAHSSAPAARASSGPALRGSVTIGSIFDIGTAAGDFDEDQGALQAGVRAVNASGGINGKELKLEICNENLDPNKARSCARQMVSDHVLATVGNQVITAEQDVDSILKQGGIPNIGPVTFSGASNNDTNSFMLSPYGDFVNVAQAAFGVKYGGPRVAQLLLDEPVTANYTPVVQGATTGSGGKYVGTVKVPQSVSDPSTQAAALLALKPDVVVLNAAPPVAIATVKDMVSLGYTGKFMSPGTTFYEKDLDQLGSAADQILVTQSFPPLSATRIPGVAQFLKDMAADRAAGDSKAPKETQEVRFSVMNNWLAVKAMAEIANQAKASDAASLTKALDRAQDVNLFGLMPAWTPNRQLGSVRAPRAVDTAYWCYGWKSGKAVLLSSKPVDMRDLVNKYGKS